VSEGRTPPIRLELPPQVLQSLSSETRTLLASKPARATVPFNLPPEGAVNVRQQAETNLKTQAAAVVVDVSPSEFQRLPEADRTILAQSKDPAANLGPAGTQTLYQCYADLDACRRNCPTSTDSPSQAGPQK
jgi:hypothetical protein